MVIVNNKIETRRGRKLKKGDIIEIEKEIFEIV
jgi:ribosome-associated protein YbcJ (S4-like RNA binding protein)